MKHCPLDHLCSLECKEGEQLPGRKHGAECSNACGPGACLPIIYSNAHVMNPLRCEPNNCQYCKNFPLPHIRTLKKSGFTRFGIAVAAPSDRKPDTAPSPEIFLMARK